MLFADVNVLVQAFREDVPEHALFKRWLDECIGSDEAFAVSDHVLAGFLRVVTHPRIFHPPTPLAAAIAFVDVYRSEPNAVSIVPGERHWGILLRVLRESDARGNLVPDAWLAALAIEHGCDLVTADRDFARFKGLRWRHPLAQG